MNDIPVPQHPKTLVEWGEYISSLSGSDLWSKAIAANTSSFMAALRSDGFTAEDISAVLKMFAGRLLQQGMKPPAGGFVEYVDMVRNDDDLRAAYQALMAAPF